MTGDVHLLRYHEVTKHSPHSVAASSHRLDWSIKPLAFKIYRDLQAVEPPEDIRRLCLLSNGVLRWRRTASDDVHGFRAAACTGALYHVELYLATAERDDLPAALYHYGAHDGLLRVLRAGDVRGALHRAAGEYEPMASAPLVFLLTSTFWRNAWKYQARAYRHAFWDGGAVLANLLAVLAADAQPASVVMGFADDEVNHMLAVDGVREACTSLLAVGAGAPSGAPVAALPPLTVATEPLSPREVRYPEIEQAHRASSLGTASATAAWRAQAGRASHEVPPAVVGSPIEEVIRRRRSARSFGRQPLTRDQLRALLAASIAPIPGDAFSPLPVEPLLIVNAVEGMAAGAYTGRLELIRQTDFRLKAAELALWQELAARAAANVYFVADLQAVLERFGERGYRVAQLAGGICGGRLELAATDMGLAATGLTFFDDAVSEFFAPTARGRQVMYLAAVGAR
ncbi:MAG: SagB/ThcOx family dehydrogenase [Chloroflexota bacterium]|nr:SagB/ThcOx family dehydrogenase [Chloroflexota bacterium]